MRHECWRVDVEVDSWLKHLPAGCQGQNSAETGLPDEHTVLRSGDQDEVARGPPAWQ